jgi:hypothetical protein
MASWLVREKRAPVMIVELLEKATRRLVRWEIRQVRSAEPVARRQKAADWRPPLLGGRQARATLRRALPACPS